MKKGLLLILGIGLIGASIAFKFVSMIFLDNVNDNQQGFHELYIPSNLDFNGVKNLLEEKDIIKNKKSFTWVATKMNFNNTIEPGKYIISETLSNKKLIEILRYGNGEQEIELTINTIDSPRELFERISLVLEADSSTLNNVFNNDSILAANNLTKDNSWAIVLSDTYKFHWDTDAEEFFNKMVTEYHKYWTNARIEKAKSKGLKPMDCIIIASIIEKESTKRDEYGKIAGVYTNRYRINMPLQADPTIKFALNQPEIKRVLLKHLEVDSPYNTYKYTGLPPGPICLPEKSTIDAVINAEHHNYLYFCASADFSGYHTFAKTLREHNKNARIYQRALNKRGIF